MLHRLVRFLRREEGGISTYVAQAVLVLAVISVGFMIVTATMRLGTVMVGQIYDFIDAVAP